MKRNYMIIEDEFLSSERLRAMVAEIAPSYDLVCSAESVKEALPLLRKHPLDLIFMDVELTDGDCFEIFSHVKVDTPVIFTTAYNEYAIRAFKVNSVDYLLKPLEKAELGKAIDKFETVYGADRRPVDYDRIKNLIAGYGSKNRIVINRGDSFLYVDVDDVAYFLSEDKYTYLHTFSGKSHIVDDSLSQLEGKLDPRRFFKASRNHIVNIRAVGEVRRHFHGRLKLYLSTDPPAEVIISAARRDEFLLWLGGEVI